MPPDCSSSLAVLGDAEIQPPKAPLAQTAPVEGARHRLQGAARAEADHPLVASQMAQTVDQPRFMVTQPAREFSRAQPLVLQTLADPGHEDEVAEPTLNGRCSRAEHLRESVPHGTESQNVERARLLERSQQFTDPLARRAVEIQPPQR